MASTANRSGVGGIDRVCRAISELDDRPLDQTILLRASRHVTRTDQITIIALKLLFICSRNRQRSLTAETIFRNLPGVDVRSAGTEPSARIRVTAGQLGWADLIFVMEKRHMRRLEQKFGDSIAGKRIVCLHIADDYGYMNEELIVRLRGGVAPYIDFEDLSR